MFIPLISALRSSSSFESCSTDKVVCLLRVVPMILLFAFVCFVYIMSTKWFYFLDCTFWVVTESNFILLLFYLLYISTKWFVLSLKKTMEYVFWVLFLLCYVGKWNTLAVSVIQMKFPMQGPTCPIFSQEYSNYSYQTIQLIYPKTIFPKVLLHVLNGSCQPKIEDFDRFQWTNLSDTPNKSKIISKYTQTPNGYHQFDKMMFIWQTNQIWNLKVSSTEGLVRSTFIHNQKWYACTPTV